MNTIQLYEVGPRDGFQNVSQYIPLETKLQIIDGLIAAGLRHMQITSFVSPKAVPQMQDAGTLASICREKYPDADLFALVPNLRGAQAAWDSGIPRVSFVVSVSESHNQANTRRSHGDSFAEHERIRESLPELKVGLDLATSFGCPFEGKKNADDVVRFLADYVRSGIEEVTLCDTIGIANPAQVRTTIDAVRREYPALDIQIHIHDTRNMGMVNTLAAIERGVDKVQSTLGGLGGCPFAPGASGNLATEDLAFMLSEMGYQLDVSVPRLVELAKVQAQLIPTGQYSGHLYTIRDHQ